MKATVWVTLAWLRTTPRGCPVLPEVYWMKAVSVSTGVGKAGGGPSTSRSCGSRTCRILGSAETLRRISSTSVVAVVVAPAIRASLLGLAVDHNPVEGLGVGVALQFPELGAALADPFLHAGHVPDLAHVALERLDLEVDRVGDVDDDLRLVPPHEVHFLDLVRLEALRQELGEGHVVPRQGID